VVEEESVNCCGFEYWWGRKDCSVWGCWLEVSLYSFKYLHVDIDILLLVCDFS
jgi:hypothetical protein